MVTIGELISGRRKAENTFSFERASAPDFDRFHLLNNILYKTGNLTTEQMQALAETQNEAQRRTQTLSLAELVLSTGIVEDPKKIKLVKEDSVLGLVTLQYDHTELDSPLVGDFNRLIRLNNIQPQKPLGTHRLGMHRTVYSLTSLGKLSAEDNLSRMGLSISAREVKQHNGLFLIGQNSNRAVPR